ncbi:hypothetical protein FQN60_017166, partial [Etheostoma spectabile]
MQNTDGRGWWSEIIQQRQTFWLGASHNSYLIIMKGALAQRFCPGHIWNHPQTKRRREGKGKHFELQSRQYSLLRSYDFIQKAKDKRKTVNGVPQTTIAKASGDMSCISVPLQAEKYEH